MPSTKLSFLRRLQLKRWKRNAICSSEANYRALQNRFKLSWGQLVGSINFVLLKFLFRGPD